MGKKKKKEELSIPVMILCIIGVVLVVLGFLLLKNENFKLRVISGKGTVGGVQITNAEDGSVLNKTINISYIANNNNYTATIQNYTGDVNVGDKITLYYDLISPESVSEKRGGYLGYLAAILGVILVIKTGPRFMRIIKDNYL